MCRDIGLDEFAGAVDRAIHVTFSRKIHDSVGLEALEQ
jgi:hypothetical protein